MIYTLEELKEEFYKFRHLSMETLVPKEKVKYLKKMVFFGVEYIKEKNRIKK